MQWGRVLGDDRAGGMLFNMGKQKQDVLSYTRHPAPIRKPEGDGVSPRHALQLLAPAVSQCPSPARRSHPEAQGCFGGVVYEGRPILESNGRWKGEIQTTRAWQFPSNHDPSPGQDSCASLRHGSFKFDSRIHDAWCHRSCSSRSNLCLSFWRRRRWQVFRSTEEKLTGGELPSVQTKSSLMDQDLLGQGYCRGT